MVREGRVRAQWFSTRGSDTDGNWGARTGRLVSSPNFQNVAKRMDRQILPDGFPVRLGPAPAIRKFIIPEPGYVLLRRDYSQQELRILAHFEAGALMAAYAKNPRLDMHAWVQDMIRSTTGLSLSRDIVKTTGFSILYGSGIAGISRRLKVPYEDARKIRDAYLAALPGIRTVQDELSALEHSGGEYWTWGDRPYKIERSTEIVPASEWGPEHEVTKSFAYKALNYLIQGSAADCTKQAMLNYDRTREYGRCVLSVHDEIVIEVPKAHAAREMRLLATAMEVVQFRVPMLSAGVVCRKSLWEAEK
jgi:DNA polymerase-1